MKVVISDYYYEQIQQEKELIEAAGAELRDYHCKTEDEVIDAAKDCDVLICQFAPITERVISAMPHCRAIIRYAIGVDNIDVKAAEAHGIWVCNVPDYSLDEVSNQAIALLMDCVKKLSYLNEQVRAGNNSYTIVKPLYRMEGKTLGLIGFGRIPRLVAKKMSGFGVKIIAFDPMMDLKAAAELGVESVAFEELLSRSDYISVHCPLTEATRHMIDRNAISKMKSNAILINTARGAVVDEKALTEALQTQRISMAGLDVTETEPIPLDSPLLKLDNAVLTPHAAWYSEEAVQSLQRKVAEEAVRALKGEKLRNPVNCPLNKRQ